MSTLVRKAYHAKGVLNAALHYHDCHELILVCRGSVWVCVNGTEYTATAGNLVLFSRYENHSVRPLSPEYERYVLNIAPPADREHSRLYSLLQNRPGGFSNVLELAEEFPHFHSLFAAIAAEAADRQPLSDEMLRLLVEQLLIRIHRRVPAAGALEGEAFEMAAALQHRFEQHCGETYTLAALAREYSVSPSLLSHRFKEITGVSVMGYLLSCRIAAAKELLSGADLPIGEIAERCGFGDSSNFSRTFRRETGLSPSRFRETFRQ